MSYRSVLNNPTASSGNVGETLAGTNYLPGNILLNGGSNTFIVSLPLGVGVWNIYTSYLALPGAIAFTSLTQTLTNTSGDVLATKIVLPKALNQGAVTNNFLPIQNDVVIKLTSPTVITLNLLMIGSSSTFFVNTITSAPTDLQYITATKLA